MTKLAYFAYRRMQSKERLGEDAVREPAWHNE